MASNFNPANALTASRFLTLPPFLYFVDRGMYQWAALLTILSGVLDKLDGLAAKLFDCKTPFGAVFDGVADGVCYGFCLIVLVAYGWVPWEPAVGVVGLGVLNTGLRMRYARRIGRAINYRSFAMERVVAIAAFLIGFGTVGYEVEFFYYLCFALMAIVVLHDAKRMLVDPVPS